VRALGDLDVDALNQWRKCWATDPMVDLAIADKEAELATGSADRAPILFNPTLRINGHQYRGSLNKVLLPSASVQNWNIQR
jgi:hypothetical protein